MDDRDQIDPTKVGFETALHNLDRRMGEREPFWQRLWRWLLRRS